MKKTHAYTRTNAISRIRVLAIVKQTEITTNKNNNNLQITQSKHLSITLNGKSVLMLSKQYEIMSNTSIVSKDNFAKSRTTFTSVEGIR